MTLEEGIKYFEHKIEQYESEERALDGLPGIYYDAKDYERCRIGVANNQQFVDWLKELKEYREKNNSTDDDVVEAVFKEIMQKHETKECIDPDTSELLTKIINDIDTMKADIQNIKSDMIVRRIKGD